MGTHRLLFIFIAATVCAQESGVGPVLRETMFENVPALVLSNDKLELTVLLHSGAFAKLLRRDDPERLSPFWNPAWAARVAGEPPPSLPSFGHFVCVDGFGSPSGEEQAAGLPDHGEAHFQLWKLRSYDQKDGLATLTLETQLERAQETFTRTIRVANGESVIYVHSELASDVAFDRPVSWAEHATIGAPFLEPFATVVDLSCGRAIMRPYEASEAPTRRLASGKEFTWPKASSKDGDAIDLRVTPMAPPETADLATVVLDSRREFAFVTAVNTRRHLVLGYLVRPSDYPWLQDWEHFSNPTTMARGLEFATQPFGMPRREVVNMHSLLDTPTFRWLPAKAKIETSFLMFYAKTPQRFNRVDDVRLENGRIVIEDNSSGERIQLSASLKP